MEVLEIEVYKRRRYTRRCRVAYVAYLIVIVVTGAIALGIDHFTKKQILYIPVWLILTFWLLVNLLDTHSTLLLTNTCGALGEANPIIRWLMGRFGIYTIIPFKLFFLTAATLLLRWLYPGTFKRMLVVLSIVIGLIAIHNYALLGWLRR